MVSAFLLCLCQRKYAAKLIDKKSFNDDKHLTMFRNEVGIMSSVQHANVVQLLETFEDSTYFYLVMEMISGGELFDMVSKIKKYSEQDASKAFGQIVKAIQHLQQHNVVHRDLVRRLSSRSLSSFSLLSSRFSCLISLLPL